jgi:hypothetical protein
MRTFYRDVLGGRQTVSGSYPRIPLQEAISAGLEVNVGVVYFTSGKRFKPLGFLKRQTFLCPPPPPPP